MSKQTDELQPSSLRNSSGYEGRHEVPQAKMRYTTEEGCSADGRNKHKIPSISLEGAKTFSSESASRVGAEGSPGKNRSEKKEMLLLTSSTCKETKLNVTESLHETRGKTAGKRKGRVVPSRYKESAKNRAAATPTKMSDPSCISIAQDKLFSTATSSTPVSAGGKVQDVSARPKAPPKMAALDGTVRQRCPAAAATAAVTGSAQTKLHAADKSTFKIKKSDKAAAVKVKPLRVEPATKTQKGKERELVSEHQLLYTQYLQWSYLRRMSEASTARERPQLSHQAQQLASLTDTARHHCADLERKLQAVTLYRETAHLERQLNALLANVNESAAAVRADLSRLATTLDATRSRLQLNGCLQTDDSTAFLGELVSAAERCQEALSALDGAVSPHANLLQHTAECVSALQRALADSGRAVTSSTETLHELSSLALQEASLSVGSGAAPLSC